ncbi:MAG: flavodoxin [Clostridia bacterium]|nr:flavodoxin [Clostridia bacterium]
MKILIIVKSKHQENTLKIAEAMSEAAPVTVATLENAGNYNLNEYDIVGYGSGIYFGKHDKELIKFVEGIDNEKSYCFVFSTSGSKNFEKNNSYLIKLLESKNKVVLDSFACVGLDKFFIFALGGGLNKNRPDINDFEAAQNFISRLPDKYNQAKHH